MVEIVNAAVSGRARFRVKELYRCTPLKEHLESRLASRRTVTRAKACTLTCGILVYYDSGDSPGMIAARIDEALSEFGFGGVSPSDPVHRKPVQPSPDPPGPNGNSAGRAEAEGFPSVSRPDKSLPEKKSLIGKVKESLFADRGGQVERPWHAMSTGEVLAAMGTSRKSGLTSSGAAEKMAEFGPNRLPEAAARSKFDILINQVSSLPVALLGAAAAISLFTGGVVDAVVIGAVVAINSVIGYVTESEAERTISSLKTLTHPTAVVIRNGERSRISAGDVVPGDLIALEPGTYISGDCRLLETTRLTVDESTLTGESMPARKEAEIIVSPGTPLADRKNMVFMGTLVTGGEGSAVVVATGRFTEIGRVQAMIGETTAPETPMERQLNRLGNQLVWISGAICGVVFLIGLARRTGFLIILKTTISLAVAAVPEGLPAVATTTLALGIRKLNRHKVIIRDLEAVETLGAVQTICFDKTGTVTENRMTVRKIHTGSRLLALEPGGFFSDEKKEEPKTIPELIQIAKVCILCNEGNIQGARIGSSTEQALLDFAVRCGLNLTELKDRYPLMEISHRSEHRQFMASLHIAGIRKRFLAVKGSPLEVLSMCDSQMISGQKVPLSEDDISAIELENERMAGGALRVLGFACQSAEGDEIFDELKGLTWLGLVGMADPLRVGMRDLIGKFHDAGIDTIMLTGDQSPTAYAIGKELELSRERPIEILDSSHLTELDTDVLRAMAQRIQVFSRVSPAHKLRIVQALQSAGKVVAMTGDGINDGPALKAADIGIAMGTGGTDVAREVADVVLEDDNLGTMVLAVAHGRTIYSNIRKSLHFLLSTNFSEIIVMFVAGTAGMGYPLSPMHLLWINLISDIFPGLALALEAPEPDVLNRPPRNPAEPIVRGTDLRRIGTESGVISLAALGAYGFGIARYGIGPKASTIAFQSLTLAQLLHAISCRSEKVSIYDRESLPPNKYLNLALGGSLALQVLTFIVPALRNLLGLAPIGLLDLGIIGIGSVLPLLANEAVKKMAQAPVSPSET